MSSNDDHGQIAALVRARRASNGTNIPREYAFSPSGDDLFFLAADASHPLQDAPRSTLYRVALPSSTPSDGLAPALSWIPVVPCLSPAGSPRASDESPESTQQTKELALLRERMRTVTHGLSDYLLHAPSASLLLPLGGALYRTPLSGLWGASPPPLPDPLGSSPPLGSKRAGRPILDAKPSPDGTLVAFVRDADLWVLCIASGRERRLTDSRDVSPDGKQATSTGGGEGGPSPPRARSCGVAEYVMQEEFDRFTAFWWSPTRNPSSGCYELLYLAVDQGPVPVVRLPLYALNGQSEYYHYPRPGDPNAVATPCVLRVPPPPPADGDPATLDAWAGSDAASFEADERWSPRPSLQAQYPWAEYVVRAGWLPATPGLDATPVYGARGFWLALLDRRQQRLEIIGFPSTGEGRGRVLLSERAHDFWINVSDNLSMLKRRRAVLYTSERTGCAHIYRARVPAIGEPLDEPPSPPREPARPNASLEPAAVTAGDDWVVEDILAIDEPRELVYYTSTRGTPLERHMCVSSFAASRAPAEHNVQQLTPPGCTHTGARVSVSASRAALNFSSIHAPVVSHVYALAGLAEAGTPQKLDDVRLELLASVANPPLHEANRAPWATPPPELFEFPAEDGAMLHGALYVPRGADGAPKPGPHPTVLVVYAGPHVQLVRNERSLTTSLRTQLLVARGYAVALVDGRGSFRRGVRFEAAVRGRFGGAELRDQVAGVEHLIARGVVDRARVAVTGWSYGAYAAALLLARWGGLFRLAVCGAPVTRWDAYDAAYTERYLGLPAENESGYAQSSVLAHADQFPAEDGRLMLVHSLMDENVHASHTVALVDELVSRQKQHALVLFPRERHGLRDPAAQLHFETAFFTFLAKNL